MIAVRTPTAIKADTIPTVHASPSMKNLLSFFIYSLRAWLCRARPGDFIWFHFGVCNITKVNKTNTKINTRLINQPLSVWFPVSTLSIYRDNDLPGPAGIYVRAFCNLLRRDIASKAICPVLTPAWHWSGSLFALCYKAQPQGSYLL